MEWRLLLIALSCLLVTCSSISGFDLSVASDEETWRCMYKTVNDDMFAIIRAYRNIGVVDENAAASIKAAWGHSQRDLGIYMFPCIQDSAYSVANNITCQSAVDQVKDTVSSLKEEGIAISGCVECQPDRRTSKASVLSVWVDIEDEVPSKYYSSDPMVNQKFMNDLVTQLESMGIKVGIYTTKTYWQNIMDNVEGYGANHNLWYPHYDDISSFDFFEPFADWTKESLKIKQIAPDIGICGLSQIDRNYAETDGYPVN